MRCIFCMTPCSSSKSVEHIIPESLGGVEHILPRGIVCDKCNNYFAREVEKPFMENEAIKLLRIEEQIPSKKGRMLNSSSLDLHSINTKTLDSIKRYDSISLPKDIVDTLISAEKITLFRPVNSAELMQPDQSVLLRFVGKIAIEAMAYRFLSTSMELIEQFIDMKDFDLLRNHVRYSKPKTWPCVSRRIYNSKKYEYNYENGEIYQVMNEFDFLLTNESECYFVLALFGMEYTINMAAPLVDGYIKWLEDHSNTSPLYFNHNGTFPTNKASS